MPTVPLTAVLPNRQVFLPDPVVEGLLLYIQHSFIVKDFRNGLELYESLCSQTYIITNQ